MQDTQFRKELFSNLQMTLKGDLNSDISKAVEPLYKKFVYQRYFKLKECLVKNNELKKMGYPSLKETELKKLIQLEELDPVKWSECVQEFQNNNNYQIKLNQIFDEHQNQLENCVSSQFYQLQINAFENSTKKSDLKSTIEDQKRSNSNTDTNNNVFIIDGLKDCFKYYKQSLKSKLTDDTLQI